MAWPSHSPDVMPIENIWALLQRNVSQKNPRSLEQLVYYIYAFWKNLKKSPISNIFNSIYDRIDMIIERKGDVIDY